MYKILLAFMITTTISFAEEDIYNHSYSTYFGGNRFEQARDLEVDEDGCVYITGGTSSPDFPVTDDAAITEYNNAGSESIGNWGPMMAFVAKFSPKGELIWSTYVGGPSYDRAYAVEVDDNGYVYIGGRAGEDFPTTPGVVQEDFDGSKNWKNSLYGKQNGFVTKLSPDGSEIIWSTYYGADSFGFFRDIAIDDEGFVYGILNAVIGKPFGIDENSFDGTHNGKKDMVAVKFSQDASQVLWATFIGGSDDDTGGPSIKAGPDKSVYVCGGTRSNDLPITDGAVQESYGGEGDMYVARFKPDGSDLIYCTYFGGSNTEATETHVLFVDHLGQAYVACGTKSTDVQTTPNAYKPITNTRDCLLFKLSTDGTELLASTYFGGSEGEHPEGLFVDKNQNLYFGGETVSTDLPVTSNAPFPTFLGETDAYVAKLNPDFSEIDFCTYYGGSDRESVRAFSVGEDGTIYISGQSNSKDLPTSDNAFQKDAPNDETNSYLSIFSLDVESSIKSTVNNDCFSISPNPASEYIEVRQPSDSEIKIYNSFGECVMTDVINPTASSHRMNVSGLPAGIYLLYIEGQTEKFIKLK